ncbi:serine/threonine-protein phosphatase [Streptomyces sp. PLK6-54]|uniref:Serine/threonine-protein phosphatase n=2 Tax=Actinacidiphila acidipaludis TaxID=2873382 RepID=A0ABS7QEA5_9ACTN|nr:serine/threonine-protein phosphatase [Streptomyces acidipaludis]
MATALALVVVIAVADVISPREVFLSPMLVVAPALAASFTGPWRTSAIALVAVGAQIFASSLNGGVASYARVWQLVALIVVSVLLVFFSYVRGRRSQQLNRARLVAETAQRVLLRPPPDRVGPLLIAWLYLTADDDTQFGGDFFAVTRRRPAASRVIVGDVRGHGLAAISEASAVLGAFREAARRCATLDELARVLEESLGWDREESAEGRQGTDGGGDGDEHFATALLLELPDHGDQVLMTCCGHPPPLLIHADGRVVATRSEEPSPPLGMGMLSVTAVHVQMIACAAGDTLLLHTDGVIEARSPQGVFYPLAERVAAFPPALTPDALLRHLRQDLLAHTGGRLTDDAALLAVCRAPEEPGPPAPAVP